MDKIFSQYANYDESTFFAGNGLLVDRNILQLIKIRRNDSSPALNGDKLKLHTHFINFAQDEMSFVILFI